MAKDMPHPSDLTRLARSLRPAEDVDLARGHRDAVQAFIAEYRRCLGPRTPATTQLLERWLRHACYEYGLSGCDDLVVACAHSMWLAHVTTKPGNAGGATVDWERAIRVALAEREVHGTAAHDRNDAMRTDHARQIQAGRAGRRLRERGYPIALSEGRLEISDDTVNGMLAELAERVRAFGGTNLASVVLTWMNRFYRPELDRYVVPKPVSNAPTNREPSYPLGYLLDCAIAAPNEDACLHRDQALLRSVLDLGRDVIAMSEVEPYSWQDLACGDVDTMLVVLARMLAYDRWFDRRQLRPQWASDLLRGAFEATWRGAVTVCGRSHAFGMESLLTAAGVIMRQLSDHRGPAAFGLFGLLDAFVEAGVAVSDAPAVLTALMHEPGEINPGFLHPNESVSTAYDKPLVRIGEHAYLTDARFFGEAAYRAASAAYVAASGLPARQSHSAIGNRFEQHVRDVFATRGIAVRSHTYGPRSERIEIDGIIQSRESIILLEVKKTELSPQARAGDLDAALRDVISSVLRAQSQAMRLELMLLQKHSVRVSDLGQLRHDGRTIENLTVLAFSYGLLHYRRVRHDVLRLLPEIVQDAALMARLGPAVRKRLAERTSLVARLAAIHAARGVLPDRFVHVLDYDQLRTLLERTTDADTFYDVLTQGSNVDFSTFDWYGEHLVYERLFGA